MKGKPWTVEEERKLAELIKSGVGLKKLMSLFGKSENAVRKKARRLGLRLEEGGGLKINPPSSSSFVIDSSGELRSIEEALKLLNGALDTLQKGGLEKTEILRLRTVIQGATVYMDRVAEFINYRVIEEKLVDLEAKYVQLLAKKAKGDASGQNSSIVV